MRSSTRMEKNQGVLSGILPCPRPMWSLIQRESRCQRNSSEHYYLHYLWSSGTLLPPDTRHRLCGRSCLLDEIDDKQSAFHLDLHRTQLLLNDACLSDGDLLSTGISTDLFRWDMSCLLSPQLYYRTFGGREVLYLKKICRPMCENSQRSERVVRN